MKKPNSLSKGDTVAIVSLSSGKMGDTSFIHKFEIAKQRLEKDFKFHVLVMPNALKGSDYLYAHPEARAKDLMGAFKNKEVKAIFNAIGGDDTIRLLPYIDFDIIKENPKIFTGFSDTTINHFMMYKSGLISYYGLSVMNHFAEYVEINEYTKKSINDMLISPKNEVIISSSEYCSYENDKVWWMKENMNKRTPRFKCEGITLLQGNTITEGKLLGGCVDTFIELIGTPLWPTLDEWKDKILLLEFSGANMSELVFTWILRNLNAQGILNVIRGIVIGRPAYKEKEEKYANILKRVVNFEANLPNLPILMNINIGHAYPTGILPLGLLYRLDCNNLQFTLLEPATSL